MRRAAMLLGAVALAAAGGAGATYAITSGGEEAEAATRVIRADPQPARAGTPELVVEDGLGDAEARRMVAAALQAVPGDAISVEREDAGAEVEVRDARGQHVEVTLDAQLRVTATETD